MNKELDTITLQAMRRSSVQFFEGDFKCTFEFRQQNISGEWGGGGSKCSFISLNKIPVFLLLELNMIEIWDVYSLIYVTSEEIIIMYV